MSPQGGDTLPQQTQDADIAVIPANACPAQFEEAGAREATPCGAQAYAHRADVRKEDEVRAMFQTMIPEFGTIDILMNRAGLQKDAPLDEMTLADWQFVLEVNLTGQFLCAREAEPSPR